jgi:hypothetical protein
MKLAPKSLILLAIQLAIVSSIAAKYYYQRSTCPRVWTRTVAYDPDLILRGRYLSARLTIDACGINLPIAHNLRAFVADRLTYFDSEGNGAVSAQLPVSVGVRNGKLVANHSANPQHSQALTLQLGASCTDATLQQPVNFYLAEHAKSPFPLAPGQALWVEVTVPPAGPPRPINLAISSNGQWQPLSFR